MTDDTNLEDMTEYFKQCVAKAIAALPEELRGYANADPGRYPRMWGVKAVHAGSAWRRTIKGYAIRFQASERSHYGRSTLKVLKSGKINQDRLNSLVSIYARRKSSIERSMNAREANKAAWEAGGMPGGERVRITDTPDSFEITFRGKAISFNSRSGVPLAQIVPVLAAVQAADARVSRALSGDDSD